MSNEKIFFFVDNVKYDTDETTLTGSQIKAMVNDLDPTYALFLEATGNDPDKQIADDESISLEKDKGPKRFYTVPPATFGCL